MPERSVAKDVAIGVALLVFAFTLVADSRVPLLAYVDLGFHELGHLLTYPFPDLVTAAAGSFFQAAVPFGLAAYFALMRSDLSASAFCLGWCATSLNDVARYVADAPYERLELLGGDHDWAFILFELDKVDSAGTYAAVVRVLAWVALLGGAALLTARYVKRSAPT